LVTSTLTFQQVPPKRPGEADIINGTKTNVTATVPPHMPAAEEYMQIARLAAAFGRMIPLLRISLQYLAGVPSVHSFASVREDIVLGDFTVTDLGVGRTSIVWPAGKFPTANSRPMVSTNRGGAAVAVPDVVLIANGVEVYTADNANAAIDADVTVSVF
jgi:hypothetical protein